MAYTVTAASSMRARAIKTILLAAALSLTAATASFAQSYDPDLGSGNIARSYGGGGRHFGFVHPSWRASVFHRHHRGRHVRHHRAR